MFRRRKRVEVDDGNVDVAARLHPYEDLFNEAMAMAARFTEERERREREALRADRPARAVRRAG